MIRLLAGCKAVVRIAFVLLAVISISKASAEQFSCDAPEHVRKAIDQATCHSIINCSYFGASNLEEFEKLSSAKFRAVADKERIIPVGVPENNAANIFRDLVRGYVADRTEQWRMVFQSMKTVGVQTTGYDQQAGRLSCAIELSFDEEQLKKVLVLQAMVDVVVHPAAQAYIEVALGRNQSPYEILAPVLAETLAKTACFKRTRSYTIQKLPDGAGLVQRSDKMYDEACASRVN